jgi:hypothetical protein
MNGAESVSVLFRASSEFFRQREAYRDRTGDKVCAGGAWRCEIRGLAEMRFYGKETSRAIKITADE